MARKNVVKYQVFDSQSLAANVNSPVTLIKYLDNCSYQINVTTTNSEGSFAIQGSNDYDRDETTNTVINPGKWITLPLAGGTAVVQGADTNILIDLNQLPFTAIRIAYSSSVAGTGSCDAYLVARQLGG